jgi:hypothetical protein
MPERFCAKPGRTHGTRVDLQRTMLPFKFRVDRRRPRLTAGDRLDQALTGKRVESTRCVANGDPAGPDRSVERRTGRFERRPVPAGEGTLAVGNQDGPDVGIVAPAFSVRLNLQPTWQRAVRR